MLRAFALAVYGRYWEESQAALFSSSDCRRLTSR